MKTVSLFFPRRPAASAWRMARGMALALCALAGSASAAVITHTLPVPYRTSLEQPMAGAPAVYHPVVAISAYPFDFNSDGTPEFIVGWSNQGIQLYVAQPEAQVITTHRSEEVLGTIVHPYPLPLPGGVLIGADPPGTNVRWGNYLPEFTADILGLGPAIGRYGMSFYMGGGEGYWYRPWNQLLPADWDYIGVRFQLEDGLHYGYLHFGYEPNTGGLNPIHYAVLRGWAWETEPGKSILIVPETSSAGMAAGAAVLAMLRRRRRG